ncbi:MAG: hypothetical protein KDB65_11995 [Calditrichaeota bacterium]|nr:hypothetical protein [Calditrichota bacterium]MCB9368987.1 hypothetical protein [Calditrichota bacterium]
MKQILAVLCLAAQVVAVPQLINYQGELSDNLGAPLDTTVAISFVIYDAASGGTTLWSETQSSVTSVNGDFHVLLGSVNPIPDSVFAGDFTWLGISVEDDSEMLPRERIASTAYSYRVGTVDGASGGKISSEVTIQDRLSVGIDNTNTGLYSFVSGDSNSVSGFAATITGGWKNTAVGDRAVIGGGYQHNASMPFTTIGGGNRNNATASNATVSGGDVNTASALRATIGGGGSNTASGEASTISGGALNTASGLYSFVGGGNDNEASIDSATVCGGFSNHAAGRGSFVGGGSHNTAQFNGSVVSGGRGNITNHVYGTISGGAGNSTGAEYATVCGGTLNSASGAYSIVAGGVTNSASGQYAFAGGHDAIATHFNSFVWSSSGAATTSFADNCMALRAHGGVEIYTNFGTGTGVRVPAGGGAWASLCDVNQKNIYGNVDSRSILDKVSSLPLYRWSYKSQDASIQHIGPTAQDFSAAFGLGDNNTTISTVDPDGVLLAAVQELVRQNEEIKTDNIRLNKELVVLQAQVQTLMAR